MKLIKSRYIEKILDQGYTLETCSDNGETLTLTFGGYSDSLKLWKGIWNIEIEESRLLQCDFKSALVERRKLTITLTIEDDIRFSGDSK